MAQNEYAPKKTDPMEIQFLTEMCLEYPDRVKDELLKVRLPAELYPTRRAHKTVYLRKTLPRNNNSIIKFQFPTNQIRGIQKDR